MMELYNNISNWQENISALPDEKLFDIMRLYLGDIKTPYNKQRLIEQLAGFIRNEKNLQRIISLLDDFDIKILTAICFIPNATKNLLVDFFSSEYSMGDIYSEISNLISRLLIYSEKDKYNNKIYLKINPLLLDKLEPLIKIENILYEAKLEIYSLDDVFSISPGFLMAFISFVNIHGCSCKADGTIKKNDANRIQSVFPGKLKCIQLLLTAFINLGLVYEGEKTYQIDKQRLKLFAELKMNQQSALLCAASCSRFSRDGLKKEAQLFIDCVSSIPQTGYTRQTLVRLAFLIGARTSDGNAIAAKSRFSKLLESARMEKNLLDSNQAGNLIDRMIDSAIEFGLLQKLGRSSEGDEIFTTGPMMKSGSEFDFETELETDSESNLLKPNSLESKSSENFPKVLNIESSFSITIMPGLSLKRLLPLSEFLAVKNAGVVTEYEINRQSISSSFDNGWNPNLIFEQLEQYTSYDLPQNLKMTISDWYNTYTSAMLYQGYILKVAQNNISFVENNPNIKKYIKEKLAEGIYLLNVPINSDISIFKAESGLEFMGRINNPEITGERLQFPLLREGRPVSFGKNSRPENQQNQQNQQNQKQSESQSGFTKASDILNELKNELEKMQLSQNQKESLLNRIRQRLILTKEQLATASVRTEILEADGMDYAGKIHLFEAAIKADDMMEITMPQYNKSDEYFKIVGKPLGIVKQYADSIVQFDVYPVHEIENLVVSRLTHIRRLRF